MNSCHCTVLFASCQMSTRWTLDMFSLIKQPDCVLKFIQIFSQLFTHMRPNATDVVKLCLSCAFFLPSLFLK